MTLPYEQITVARLTSPLRGLIDPSERRLYLDPGADLQLGDTVGFRGYTRRIVEAPEVWADAGVVATFEAAPAYLPDLGILSRRSGPPGVLDETTGEAGAGSEDAVWSGPCSVERTEGDGFSPDVGDQPVGVVPFVVKVPLELVDVRPGDLFRVTRSRDGRLLVRTLVVRAVRASSIDLVRELLAFDNQGC